MNDIGEVSNGLVVEDRREPSSPVGAETAGVTQIVPHVKRKKKKRKAVAKPCHKSEEALHQTNLLNKEKSKMETNSQSGNQSPSHSESSPSAVETTSVSNSSHINGVPPESNLGLVQRLWLEVNHLSPLKKKNAKHPSAHFYCNLCSYYCTSFSHCEQHTQERKHCCRSMKHGEFTTLVNLPAPTRNHIDALSEMLHKFAAIFGLSDEEKQLRVTFANRMNAYISEHLPGCGVCLYGSSITGVGLKCSNVNLDFYVALHLNAPVMLKAAYNLLHESCDFVRDVTRDFHDEIPCVYFSDEATSMRCILSLHSHEAHKTSELLACYLPLDPRVQILGTCFRLWAKMCKIDDHFMGLLPAYSYNLLLVYFLQQVQPPVLPVLKDSTSELSWTSTNTMPIGELWVKLFRFYVVDYPKSENVVCIRSKEPVKRVDKHWTGKKIAIEDPYLPKRNVSRYIVHHASHEYIQDCLKHSYKYFGIPQTELGPIFALIRQPMEEYRQLPEVEKNVKRSEVTLNAQMDRDARFKKLEEAPAVRNISVSELEEKLRELSLHKSPNSSSAVQSLPAEAHESSSAPMKPKSPSFGNYSGLVVSPKLAEVLCNRLRKEYHCFKMDGDTFTAGKLPPVVCIICQQEGHERVHCPDNHFPPLQPLPPMQDFFIELLDEICCRLFKHWSPSIQEIEERQSIVNILEAYLRRRYPTVKLELFGSSCNGFGFHRSDLDMCLTFMDNKTGEDINYVCLIEELVRYLKAYGKLTNLIPVTAAKVPIVKFTYPKYRVDCDISLYNTLAQRNTRMLKTYAQIDPRVQILGFTMKYFAKLCGICDASRGSLSSYAYVLMVIYFLQQCDPPVLPVLQQLHPTDQKPEVIVEGWNTWFFDGPQHLSAVWPDYGKNTASPGRLWLQMLRFYTEEFDFNEYVVSIRQKEKLLCFEKLWNSKCMAIEDPFDLTHNLGSGLSRKMNNFIIKAFRNGRMHFGTPLRQPPMPYADMMMYLFDPKYLCDGQPPNADRGCRVCKKIGHVCKDCPERRGSQKRPVEKRAEKLGGSPTRDQTNKHRGREGFHQVVNVRPKREHVPQVMRNPPSVQQIPNHLQQQQQPLLPRPLPPQQQQQPLLPRPPPPQQQQQSLLPRPLPPLQQQQQPLLPRPPPPLQQQPQPLLPRPPPPLQQQQPLPPHSPPDLQRKLLNAGDPRNVAANPPQVTPTPQEMMLNAVAGPAQQNNWWPVAQRPVLRANFPSGQPVQANLRFPHASAPPQYPTPVSQFNTAPVTLQSTTSSELGGQAKAYNRKQQLILNKKNTQSLDSEVAAGSSTDPQGDAKKKPRHRKQPTLYFRRSAPPQ